MQKHVGRGLGSTRSSYDLERLEKCIVAIVVDWAGRVTSTIRYGRPSTFAQLGRSMEDSGPVASTSTANDLFGAFYEPLQQASKAARSGREEQVDHLDAEYGLAVSWQRAIAAR